MGQLHPNPKQVSAKLAAGPRLQAERDRLHAARPVHVAALRACAQHPFGCGAADAAVDRYITQLVVLYYLLLCVDGLLWWGEVALLPPGRHGMDVRLMPRFFQPTHTSSYL